MQRAKALLPLVLFAVVISFIAQHAFLLAQEQSPPPQRQAASPAEATPPARAAQPSPQRGGAEVVESPEELFKGLDTKLLAHQLLSDGYTYDDFPSIAVGSDGTAWVVYTAFTGQEDEIRIRKFSRGKWNTFTRVPGVSGDVWMPKALVDSQGRPWVIWSQQVKGNWDIYARALEGKNWLKLERLATSPAPDINPAALLDSKGRIVIAWQGFRDGQSDIFLKICDSGQWSDEIRLSSSPANDWFPAVAADSAGRIHVAWDSYRNENYDVFLRSYLDGVLSEELAVTSDPRYQVNPSLACDREGRLWIAWESGDVNWAKDQGHTSTKIGSTIYGSRSMEVKVLADGSQMETPANALQSLPAPDQRVVQLPSLQLGPDGRMWLLFRHARAATDAAGRRRSYWLNYVTWYKGNSWAEAIPLPESRGRISAYASIAPAPDGRLWAAWPTDGRVEANYHAPVHDQVYAGLLEALSAPGEAELTSYAISQQPTPRPGHKDEPGDVAVLRNYTANVGGKGLRILRGDLHRHTEFSWDNGGVTDGSILEFYRYMIDAASMDFGALTDHNAGGDYLYWYWLTQKTSDLFHAPKGFAPLYGYERSAVFPWGHRNIFHSRRGVPVVSFFTVPDFQGPRPGVGSGNLMQNDTDLLYQEIERTGGIAIAHTTGTSSMGTDWAASFRGDLEPVVEIFQGCRNSYEEEAGPRAAKQGDAPGGFNPGGFVWVAWEKGYRLGVIASSDHVSTHISYAMVYAEDLTREAIIDAIKKRHTYGATDNILLDYRIGDHLMGEEFTSSEQPVLKVKIRGTGPVSRVDVIKNNTYLHAVEPMNQEVEFSYQDMQIQPGTSYYYVRVQQQDGQLAWSSPIWVDYKP